MFREIGREVFIKEFLSRVEEECKLRDSRVQQLWVPPALNEDSPLYLEVWVTLKDGARLPLKISPQYVQQEDIPGIVGSILMTVERYSWGLI